MFFVFFNVFIVLMFYTTILCLAASVETSAISGVSSDAIVVASVVFAAQPCLVVSPAFGVVRTESVVGLDGVRAYVLELRLLLAAFSEFVVGLAGLPADVLGLLVLAAFSELVYLVAVVQTVSVHLVVLVGYRSLG